MKKRLMALLLTLAMVATFMPAMALTAFAGKDWDAKFYVYTDNGSYKGNPEGYSWNSDKKCYYKKIKDITASSIKAKDHCPKTEPTRENYYVVAWLFSNDNWNYDRLADDSKVNANQDKGYFKPLWGQTITLVYDEETSTDIYRISHDNKYYSEPDCNIDSKIENNTITIQPKPGYTFEGYYDAVKDGTKKIDKDGKILDDGLDKCTLYAHWTLIPAGNPTIDDEGQPKDEVMTADENGELNVSATAGKDGDELSYQWYINTTKSTEGGEPIEGATDSTYTVPVETVAGEYYYYCKITETNIYNYDSKSIFTDVATVTAENPVIKGTEKVTRVEGKKSEVTFTSNAPADTLIAVRVDNEVLSAYNYTVKSGSTIVTLKPEYVSTLKVGVHEVEIVSARGTASAELKIVPENGVATGDVENLMLWMMFAVAAMVAAGYAVSRKEN